MNKKKKAVSIIVFAVVIFALFIGSILVKGVEKSETLSETMTDAVLHESAKISLFGITEVNPGLISAYIVSAVLIVFAIIVRIFVIPKFKIVPGKFQMLLEQAVGLFDNLAKGNSPHRNGFLGAYIFSAGAYIFMSTLFELFGVQAVTTSGNSISLSAPLSDINGAIAMGVMSYGVIFAGGVIANKGKGVLLTLKEFSLPVSMSFRLFGALLSGALVTELVYYSTSLSYVVPVFVAVMFTLLHALIQAYVLTMLTSVYYGEVTEPGTKKSKTKKIKNS